MQSSGNGDVNVDVNVSKAEGGAVDGKARCSTVGGRQLPSKSNPGNFRARKLSRSEVVPGWCPVMNQYDKPVEIAFPSAMALSHMAR